MEKISAYLLVLTVAFADLPLGKGVVLASEDTLRATSAAEQSAGLEELENRLHDPKPVLSYNPSISKSQVAVGLEEKTSRADAQRILREFFPDWSKLSSGRKSELTNQFMTDFRLTYKEWKGMMALLSPSGNKAPKYRINKEFPFPMMRWTLTTEEIRRGKEHMLPKTAFLLGAGGAGSRLFDDIEKFVVRRQLLERMEHWNELSGEQKTELIKKLNDIVREGTPNLLPPAKEVSPRRLGAVARKFRAQIKKLQGGGNLLADVKAWSSSDKSKQENLIDKLNEILKENNPRLLPLEPDKISTQRWTAALGRFRLQVQQLQTNLIENLGLSQEVAGQGLADLEEVILKSRTLEAAERYTKPTFPLGKGLPSPLAIWLKILVKGTPNAIVVMGVSTMTEEPIRAFLAEAYQGLHGSPKGTYFGLTGPIAFVIDPQVPVVNAETGKLTIDPRTGGFYKGGMGGAGSLIALRERIKLLQPNGDLQELPQTGFEWLRIQGKDHLFVGDSDTVGMTPDRIWHSLGIMERHNHHAVAFTYPHPNKGQGRLVNLDLEVGTRDERRGLANIEDKDVSAVEGLKEAIAHPSPDRPAPANAGIYLLQLRTLEALVKESAFPWHETKPLSFPEGGHKIQRFEKWKPDYYLLMALQSERPLYTPIVKIEPGEVLAIKNTAAIAVARKRYLAIADQIAGGLEEPQGGRGEVLQRLANLPGTQVVVIANDAADRYPELVDFVGQPRSVGNTQFIVLPRQPDAQMVSSLLAPLLGASSVTLLEYGDPGAFTFVEGALQGLEGITILGPYSLKGDKFLTAFRQILAALAGMEEEAISDTELIEAGNALGLRLQA